MTSRFRRVARRSALAVAVGAAACNGSDTTPTDNGPPMPAPSTVTVNGSAVSVTIAATRAARNQGLMGVRSLGANSGMLFVFADDRQRFLMFATFTLPTGLAIEADP